MKRNIISIYICTALLVLASCNDEDSNTGNGDEIQIEALTAQLGDRDTANKPSTRATSEFAVNTTADPTHESTRITGGGDWIFSINIQDKNNADYPPGNAICSFSIVPPETVGSWKPQTDLYFPSYKTPHIIANLYPQGWVIGTTPIAYDQSDSTKLVNQDVLVQNGSTYTVAPSHKPTIVLRHGHSMLNFMLENVDETQIANINVFAGGNTYQPYKVEDRTNPEYMVILPVGTVNPVVNITTTSGARYQETVNIPTTGGTRINICYCVKLMGIELILSSVTVIDWIYGTALEGSYTTITSYPTFRGNPNTIANLVYDNGQQQQLQFNENGEATGIKPLGRVIVTINSVNLATPVILDSMYVDLRSYL